MAPGTYKTCIDSPAKRTELHKPVGLYPCHNQGGNQVRMQFISIFIISNVLYLFSSFGSTVKLVKFVATMLVLTFPDRRLSSTHATDPKAISYGFTMMR